MTDKERILAMFLAVAVAINVGIIAAYRQSIIECTQQRLNATAIAGADRVYDQLYLMGKLK